MQPPIWDQAWSMFVWAFQYPGLDVRLVPISIALALAFGAAWLALYRPPARNVAALGAVAGVSAALAWTGIAFLQVPLQLCWDQVLLTFWTQETVMTWVLLAGIPPMLLTGLVQEAAKIVPVVAFRASHRSSFDARAGLLVGAIAGAGFGVFEAVWAHNATFASGIGLQTFQADPFAAVFPFAQRFLAVGLHVGLSALVGYGLATGRGLRFYLAAATLHGVANYVIVLGQAGLLGSPGALLYMGVFTVALSAAVLRVLRMMPMPHSPAAAAPGLAGYHV